MTSKGPEFGEENSSWPFNDKHIFHILDIWNLAWLKEIHFTKAESYITKFCGHHIPTNVPYYSIKTMDTLWTNQPHKTEFNKKIFFNHFKPKPNWYFKNAEVLMIFILSSGYSSMLIN